ncbi:hypothetical protein F5Y19DRAFT_40705 [Xylariaceae sp. FL1651]|nr:hypothetical protein F5Y19DRAFT_40705 [Xylariaceae sp. FL1651]
MSESTTATDSGRNSSPTRRDTRILGGNRRRTKRTKNYRCRKEWKGLRYMLGGIWRRSMGNQCKAQGCRAETRSIRYVHGQSMKTSYCTRHLCNLWRAEEMCCERRSRGESYCTKHACQYLDCKERRRDIVNSGRFCWNHSCRSPECEQVASYRHGYLCPDHACRASGCDRVVPGTNDPAKAKQDNFCDIHRCCQLDNCMNPIYTLTTNAARKFCAHHYCDVGETCGKPRVGGTDAKACPDHTCRLFTAQPSCCKPKTNINGMYCGDHECKENNCLTLKYHATDWCSQHLCMAALTHQRQCNNRRDGIPDNRDYCKDHKKCTVSGCDDYGAVVNNVKQDKCDNHSKPSCQTSGCDKTAENPKGGPMYCDRHTCAFHQCAMGVIGPPLVFCVMHKCHSPGCLQARVVTNPSSHGLAALSLLVSWPLPSSSQQQQPSSSILTSNFLLPVGLYCASHKCEVVDCQSPAVGYRHGIADRRTNSGGGGAGGDDDDESQFCSAHKCREPGCGLRITGSRAGFCVRHECSDKDCRRPVVPDNGGFCDMHGGGGGRGGGGDDYFTGVDNNIWGSYRGGASGRRKSLYPPLRW